jgi:hypothetical protein
MRWAEHSTHLHLHRLTALLTNVLAAHAIWVTELRIGSLVCTICVSASRRRRWGRCRCVGGVGWSIQAMARLA